MSMVSKNELIKILSVSIKKVSDAEYMVIDSEDIYKISKYCAEVLEKSIADKWIDPKDKLPVDIVEGEVVKTHKSLVISGEKTLMAYYFPHKFRTIEFDDWNDFDEYGNDSVIVDNEKGIVWLREGWYEELYHPTDDYYIYRPVSVSAWQPIPKK